MLICVTSCAPYGYYQVFELNTARPTTIVSDKEIYITGPLQISLNTWSVGGNTALTLTNTTDTPLYVDVPHTHLIVDGFASSYYTSSSETNTHSSGSSRSYGYSFLGSSRYYRSASAYSFAGGSFRAQSNAITINHPQTLIIPPHSYKQLEGFSLVSEPLKICPNREQRRRASDSLADVKDTRPFTSVRIEVYYSAQPAGQLQVAAVDMQLDRVSIVSGAPFVKRIAAKSCPGDLQTFINYYKFYRPNRFYLLPPKR